GQRQLLRPGAAADSVRGFEDADWQSGPRKCDRRREPVRAGANDDDLARSDCHAYAKFLINAPADAVRPGCCVLEVSARTGEGMAGWIALLEAHAAAPAAQAERALPVP